MSRHDFVPVILGSDLNAYGMARSFHMAYGIKSYAIGKGVLFMTRHSKIIDVKVCDNLDQDDVFVTEMITYAKELKKHGEKLVLVASSDNYAELVIRNRKALEPHYKLPFTTEEMMNQLIYKSSFYEMCDTHGLEYPKTLVVTRENYSDVKIDFPYPIVIKASDSMTYFDADFPGKKKAYIIKEAKETQEVLKAIYASSYDKEMIIQEFIPGEDDNMRVVNTYSRGDGKVSMMSLGRPLLEDCSPLLIGNYVAIISEYNESIYSEIKRFLEGINYTGYANFDFKYDSRDGKYKVFEINLRQGRSSFFSTASGFNLAEFMVEDLVYGKKEETKYNDNEFLWLNVSKKLVLKYLDNQLLLSKVNSLVNEDKYADTLYYKEDKSLRRLIDRHKYYSGYNKRFKQYFTKK